MIYIKYICMFAVFFSCIRLGQLVSNKYIMRVKELENLKSSLIILESKIKFTYEPILEIFKEISEKMETNINNIFKSVVIKVNKENNSISKAWEDAVDESITYMKTEDKYAIKSLSKLLGQTDIEGQISQIRLTEKFLDKQIKEAQEEKSKNQKLCSKLGVVVGLAIVIILI